jgi:hypothetical protein
MCKVAVRAKFTPGVVTVNATVTGLPNPTASTTFTIVPYSDAIPTYGTVHPAVSSAQPAISFGTTGKMIRYFISGPATVAIDILDANGRMIKQFPDSRQVGGWHPIMLSGAPSGDRAAAGGVYFVRCKVDGKYQAAKRIFFIR